MYVVQQYILSPYSIICMHNICIIYMLDWDFIELRSMFQCDLIFCDKVECFIREYRKKVKLRETTLECSITKFLTAVTYMHFYVMFTSLNFSLI